MTTEFTIPDYSERPTVEPMSESMVDYHAVMWDFTSTYGVPASRKLISLGYGPRGEHDSNYNPVFRRRFYMTLDDVMHKLHLLYESYNTIYTEDIKEQLDEFISDIKWFLTSRNNIRSGSIPHDERRLKNR